MVRLLALLLTLASLEIPTGQVRINEPMNLHAAPDTSAEVQARGRYGDIFLIYEIRENWGRSDDGWLMLDDLILEAAVVQYSAEFTEPVALAPAIDDPENDELSPDKIAGAVAILGEWVYLYGENDNGESSAGWGRLADVTLTEPAPDLVDFLERHAYVIVESAALYAIPDSDQVMSELPLGRDAAILSLAGEWVLVRAGHDFGWSHAANFEISPPIVARGTTTAGDVNFREGPGHGRILTTLNYQEKVLIIGRNQDGKWLYVRTRDTLYGWVFSRYIETDEIDFPVIPAD